MSAREAAVSTRLYTEGRWIGQIRCPGIRPRECQIQPAASKQAAFLCVTHSLSQRTWQIQHSYQAAHLDVDYYYLLLEGRYEYRYFLTYADASFIFLFFFNLVFDVGENRRTERCSGLAGTRTQPFVYTRFDLQKYVGDGS